MNTKIQYTPECCPTCGQTTTYLLSIDHGTVEVLKAIARFIGRKGINIVHPRKEMEGAYLSSNQVGNLSRARFHGLIASVAKNPGNYLLTTKGAAFLRGAIVPRTAIVSKAEGRQIGYHEEDRDLCTIKDFLGAGEYWEGINYDITAGYVVKTLPKQQTLV